MIENKKKIEGAESPAQQPFVKRNFLYMGICLVMIVLGFALMGGSANEPGAAEFNYDIFSVRRVVIGPAIAFLGFVAMAFAIIYTPKATNNK